MVGGISPVGEEKAYNGKNLPKNLGWTTSVVEGRGSTLQEWNVHRCFCIDKDEHGELLLWQVVGLSGSQYEGQRVQQNRTNLLAIRVLISFIELAGGEQLSRYIYDIKALSLLQLQSV